MPPNVRSTLNFRILNTEVYGSHSQCVYYCCISFEYVTMYVCTFQTDLWTIDWLLNGKESNSMQQTSKGKKRKKTCFEHIRAVWAPELSLWFTPATDDDDDDDEPNKTNSKKDLCNAHTRLQSNQHTNPPYSIHVNCSRQYSDTIQKMFQPSV